MGEFIVQKGQTLSQIAKMHNTTVEAIAKQNGIKDVNKISIGQKLTIGSKPKETKKSELGDIDKRIAANQKEIEKLQAQGISDLVKKDINALEAELKGLGKQAYAEMMKEVKAAEKKLIAAYRKGSDAYAKVRKEVIKEFNIALGAAKAVFDGAVDAAKQGAKKVVRTGKKAARNVRDGLKMKERPVIRKTPDFSKMTKDQILAYQQKEIQKLKDEGITDKIKKEIMANINAADRYITRTWNSAVDGAYNTARNYFNAAKNAVTQRVFGK